MRPGQNKRMRGRNNRKGPNPLSRAYESNGPDVKIRGTAQHVAEKYLQLARDAQSSGDPVMAENYLQHSEHYFRIISAAQAAQQQVQLGYGRNGEEVDDGDEDDDFVALPDRFASPFERAPQTPQFPQPQQGGGQMGYNGQQPQPYFDRPAFAEQAERPVERTERQDRNQDRAPNPQGDRQDRQPRNDRRFGQQGDRQGGNDRQGNDRQGNDRQGGDRQQGQGRNRFRDQQPRFEPAPINQEQPRVDFDAVSTALPAFITAPSRPPVSPAAPVSQQELSTNGFVEHDGASASPDFAGPANADDGENHFHLRPRRRRRPRSETAADGGDAPLPETSSAD
jgi:hypothetical protein